MTELERERLKVKRLKKVWDAAARKNAVVREKAFQAWLEYSEAERALKEKEAQS